MRGSIQWFAAAAILLAMFSSSLAADSRIQTQMLDPVVLLERNCSGVIISSEPTTGTVAPVVTKILTAKHCIRGSAYVTFDERDPDTGQLISITQKHFDVVSKATSDLAVIQLRDKKTVYPTATIADRVEVQQGDPVLVVGWPMGIHKHITQGMYQGMGPDPRHDIAKEKPDMYIVASAPVTGGNSGGAMFQKTSDGYEVIGITSLVAGRYPNLGWWVPLSAIHKALETKPKSETATADLAKKLADRLQCEEKAETDEDKAACSTPEDGEEENDG